jgi:hypothetical protein
LLRSLTWPWAFHQTMCFRRATLSEAQLFATLTFPEIYERVLVQPLFRPFAEELIARLAPIPPCAERPRGDCDVASAPATA